MEGTHKWTALKVSTATALFQKSNVALAGTVPNGHTIQAIVLRGIIVIQQPQSRRVTSPQSSDSGTIALRAPQAKHHASLDTIAQTQPYRYPVAVIFHALLAHIHSRNVRLAIGVTNIANRRLFARRECIVLREA